MVMTGLIGRWAIFVQAGTAPAPMQFNTALCFVLAGVALAAWVWGRGLPAVSILGAIISLIGAFTIIEYLFRANLHIDGQLFHPVAATNLSDAGRMAPISAGCFAMAGAALILLGARVAPRTGPAVIGTLASIVISVNLAALLGYALGLPGTYGWTQFTRVPVYSALGFCLLGAGLVVIAWKLGLPWDETVPRWLPVPLTLAVFTGSLVLYIAMEGKQERDFTQTVRGDADGTKTQIDVRMDARFRYFARMATGWQVSGPPTQAAWEADAANMVRDVPDVQALQWIDASHHVRWATPLGGGKLVNTALDDARLSAFTEAETELQPVITSIVDNPGGGPGFIIYAPITVKGQPYGCIAVIFKAQTCLERYLPPNVAGGEAITVSEEGRPFFARDADQPPARADWVVQEKVDLRGATWDLRVWPTPALAARLDSPLPLVVLWAGIAGGLLLGAVSFYAKRAASQAAETARANTALRTALDTVKTLEGLLPICCACKRVRDESGYWAQFDTYLRRHTKAAVSHGYCPECAARFYEDCGIDIPENIKLELEARNFE
jgi:sensor domain CHASE-containing protein